MFCNQKISKDKTKEILRDIEDLRKCPVCNSDVRKPISGEIKAEEKEKAIASLTNLHRRVKEKSKEYSSNQTDLDSLTKELAQLWEEKESVRKQLENKALEVDDISLMLSKPEIEKKQEETSHYDRDIIALEKEMDYWSGEIGSAKISREKASQKLTLKSKEFDEILQSISSNLVDIFKKYVGGFFDDCELVVRRRITKDSRIYFNLFVPKFGGSERISPSQVSRSEAVFLDYAFRLSLSELYKNITGNESLLVIETSEGLFDPANAPILAQNIANFFDVSYLLIISNLGRPDFLEALVKRVKEGMTNRVLNYFEIGRLSQAQEKDKDAFNEQLRGILKH